MCPIATSRERRNVTLTTSVCCSLHRNISSSKRYFWSIQRAYMQWHHEFTATGLQSWSSCRVVGLLLHLHIIIGMCAAESWHPTTGEVAAQVAEDGLCLIYIRGRLSITYCVFKFQCRRVRQILSTDLVIYSSIGTIWMNWTLSIISFYVSPLSCTEFRQSETMVSSAQIPRHHATPSRNVMTPRHP